MEKWISGRKALTDTGEAGVRGTSGTGGSMKAGRMKAGSMNRMIGLVALAGASSMLLPSQTIAQSRPPGFFVMPPTPNAPGTVSGGTLSNDARFVGVVGPPPRAQADINDSIAFVWSDAGGYREAFTNELDRTRVRGFSSDGSVVVGTGHVPGTPIDTNWEPIRRVGNGSVERLGRFDATRYSGTPKGVSADGNTVVVQLEDRFVAASGRFAAQTARWTVDSGLQLLPNPWGFETLDAGAISADGRTIVGAVGNNGGTRAMIWTESQGSRLLPGLSSRFDFFGDFASDVTPDGRIAVGAAVGDDFRLHLVMWENGVIRDLGVPVGSGSAAGAFVSSDASVIVGRGSFEGSGSQWFVWTLETGSVRINDYVRNSGVNLPAGVEIRGVGGLSDDGKTITGFFTGPDGSGSFTVTIPTPHGSVAGLCMVMFAMRRQRSVTCRL
jgi:uncharacterized membrane protein